MKALWRVWVSGLGLGYLPLAPATWGSLLGLGLAWGLSQLAWPLGPLLGLGLWGFSYYAITQTLPTPKADPPWIVADEFSAYALLPLLYPITTWKVALWSFVLFRFWDICKIEPAGWLEKRPGALGILLDDVVAIIYTALCLKVLCG